MQATRRLITVITGLALVSLSGMPQAYPLDGYEETGIRRLEGARLAHEGVIKGSRQLPGALLTTDQVDLRLLGEEIELPPPDAAFTAQIVAMLGENSDRYGVAVLDLSDTENLRYAEHRGDYRQNVGSVGKLIGALGLFQALSDAWPNDTERRTRLLHDTVITADSFSVRDHHTVHFFDVDTRELVRRQIAIGDQGSLWEYLDWMLSVSSNSAAAMVMRDAMLLRQFGKGYPIAEPEIRDFFSTTSARELTALFQRTFWEPVTRSGLSLDQIRQGSFFTHQGKLNVNGGGTSYATARSLMELLLKMEKGELVDPWSSRQLKRLLYMTDRRIRYASSPELRDAGVYFKSGSLYKCRQEAGFKCTAYHGNVMNYMNSVAIVEQQIGETQLRYMVVLISNVLRQNSALDHQTLGTDIHRLIKYQNGVLSD